MSVEHVAPVARTRSRPAVSVSRARGSVGEAVTTGLAEIVLIVWAVLVIFPFIWMVMTSFKADQEIFFSPWALPTTLHWDNFVRAWSNASIGPYFINSL